MVLLTFDIEEFDLPTEYGQTIDFSEQIRVSSEGLERILDVLELFPNLRATFYSTVRFMESMPSDLRVRLLSGGHEIASHGVNHSSFAPEDYLRSRLELERLTGQEILGFRMARMQPINPKLQQEAGYRYDSSLNPTFLPGRYNHWSKPRLPHLTAEGVWVLPTSVVPYCRLPLFWLSMHVLPFALYTRLSLLTEQRDNYLNIYFHPWEFADLRVLPYDLPAYILHNSGVELQRKLRKLIETFLGKGRSFGRTKDYLEQHQRSL